MQKKRCEICEIELESHKYYSHLREDHGVTNVYTDSRLNSYEKEMPAEHYSSRTKTKSNEKEISTKEKKQDKYKPTFYPDKSTTIKEPDGSRGWHNIRDHGQFGSHPSFEPMDDD